MAEVIGEIILQLSRLYPPAGWCMPAWHSAVIAADARWGSTKIASGCPVGEDGNISCRPEAMRADAEKQTSRLGLMSRLPMDVYALARNIQSEFGSGTPEERVAIAYSTINRAKRDGDSVAAHVMHHTSRTFGRQTGSIRPVSTAQDPTAGDILLANMILSGEIQDFTHGATHYFDRVAQDASSRSTKSGLEVYDSWSSGGDKLTWVGHLPNVRPWRLLLLKTMRDLDAGDRARIIQAGRLAVQGKNRAPDPSVLCAGAGGRLVMAGAVAVGAVLGHALAGRLRVGGLNG
jgi:hypothetical protein